MDGINQHCWNKHKWFFSLLKHNFYPPRALFRLLDTLSHIIIAIKFATKLNTKHKEFLLSFQSISWSSFYPHSWNSMSCFTGQYNNTMSLSILCHSERAVQAGPASCNHWYLVKHFIFKYFLFCLPRWQQKITASLQY